MPDCPNVEIRELLPERAGGALSAADIARVDAHLVSCEHCHAELVLIQAARRTLRVAPAIDVARIASVVVTATVAPSRPQLVSPGTATLRQRPRLRWVGWKAAAAVAIAAAGIGSFAVWHSADDGGAAPNGGTVAAAQASSASAPAIAPAAAAVAAPVPAPATMVAAAPPSAAQPAELGVGGGLNELSSGDLQSLLGDLGTSGSVAADPSFEEPDVIVPEVGVVNGWESL